MLGQDDEPDLVSALMGLLFQQRSQKQIDSYTQAARGGTESLWAVRIVLNTYYMPVPIDKVVKKAIVDFCPDGSYLWDIQPRTRGGDQ